MSQRLRIKVRIVFYAHELFKDTISQTAAIRPDVLPSTPKCISTQFYDLDLSLSGTTVV